ncbi:MAG: FAD-dependent oxidoreductase [Hellea sp.]|nr:FAD-dependent oxidoreductase [Hellea sp.]
MKPTNTNNPDYFHKVVDCQWACPAHTPVPTYIRQIAQGDYTGAYLTNRESNVFPGVLGRVCDRPCEPACRRGRVEEKPVAICRLKRVAADHRDDIKKYLPKKPLVMNGKKIALIGAGPASFTVANDLAPLGYQCTIFEKLSKPGGLMRSNIPAFRLPEEVLTEELNYILDMGVELKLDTPIKSMKSLLDEGYDSIFVGSGAPKGKDLNLPNRWDDKDHIHIGINWLEEVAFEHTKTVGDNVLIIGVGNTAMDCCRTSLRLGAKSVKVMGRKPRSYFKASKWEVEDAEEENVEIIVNHSPEAFITQDGRLTGMLFSVMKHNFDNDGNIINSQPIEKVTIPCDDVILAIGQENAFPWIELETGIKFDKWSVPIIDKKTFESTKKGVFFGGDSAFGPKNIIWAVEHGHQAAISIHNYCRGVSLEQRVLNKIELKSTKMGMFEWSYSNSFDGSERRKMEHLDLVKRFSKLNIEVEIGFSPEQIATEVQRCLNCDIQTVFDAPKCTECDACIDICPVECLSITENANNEEILRESLNFDRNEFDQSLFISEELKFTNRIMVKDENICLHCGLCAERCPTAAWDMSEGIVKIHHAGTQDQNYTSEVAE